MFFDSLLRLIIIRLGVSPLLTNVMKIPRPL